MASKKNHKRHSNSVTLPLTVVAGFAVPARRVIYHIQTGGIYEGLAEISRDFIGLEPSNGSWNFSHLRYGALPVVVGLTFHKIATAIGLNRWLARSGVPLIRI